MERLAGLLGVLMFLFIAFALSSDRHRIRWRLVIAGLVLEFIVGAICLGDFLPGGGVVDVIDFADAGTEFIFGKLGDANGPWGFVFAVKVLPVIVFFASLMSVLYHLRIMQVMVAAFAWVLRGALGITGTESISAAANIFVGQTEAPLMVRPYIPRMTSSQLMSIMTGGFATIAGSVMAAYVGLLGGDSEAGRVLFAKHLLVASVMSTPGSLVIAKLMIPETETPEDETLGTLMKAERTSANVIDAAVVGASDGLKLALNVAAMLVAFVALIALIDWPLRQIGDGWSLSRALGVVFRPAAWLMGVPWEESGKLGSLLGTQIIATEFKAYLDLSKHIADGTMSSRACQIGTYALCGFANIPSIGIQIGGLSAMAPDRRQDLVRLAPRAMLAGALACWMTGAIAGVFIR